MTFLRNTYYHLKPYLPLQVRLAARRRLAGHIFSRSSSIWPIKPAARRQPSNWPGWPNGKKFCFVLTHDVEGREGLQKTPQLAALEESLGFRSSFNFIPEGSYSTPPQLRASLSDRGFEVGVHDLYHDGKLYKSREEFQRHAQTINHYLREWKAVGFRSGFMHHNLEWLHDLEIAYDMSTFDTDPFEPQPDGADTIFPFWVPNPSSSSAPSAGSASESSIRQSTFDNRHSQSDPSLHPPRSGTLRTSNFELRTSPGNSSSLNRQSSFIPHPSAGGYLELPYTLPQDSTLFFLLGRRDINIWTEKLDWIATQGGMALLNVHPDYISFRNQSSARTYPADLYRELLEYIQQRYAQDAWFALPREVAAYCANFRPEKPQVSNKRVCMVSYSFYESDNRVMRYAEALTDRGDCVEVLALAKDDAIPRHELLEGVDLSRVQSRQRNEKGKFAYLLRILRFLAHSSAILSWRHLLRRYDVVHVHNVPDFLVFAAWFPKLTGARIILDIHDILPEFFASKFAAEEENKWYFDRLLDIERASCNFAHHVIIANHLWYDKITARSVPPSKCSVVLNFVDSNLFSPRPRTRASDKLIAIFPGGLQEHQGLDIAIRAFVSVIREFPNAEFHIYGDGNMKEPWIKLSQELGLQAHIKFFDPLRIRAIVDKVANADVGLVPKRADSFGNEAYSTKIMEFMAMGIPVIASRTRIDQFYFTADIVTFFESGNAQDLAEKIADLFRNSASAREQRARGLAHAAANTWDLRKHEYFDIVDANASVPEPLSAQRLTEGRAPGVPFAVST